MSPRTPAPAAPARAPEPARASGRPGPRGPAAAIVPALVLTLLTCGSERATAEDCATILDRIVALELAEQGYRDPELTRRKQHEFARRFAAELHRCEGLSLPPGARQCVARAASTEEISHVCLR